MSLLPFTAARTRIYQSIDACSAFAYANTTLTSTESACRMVRTGIDDLIIIGVEEQIAYEYYRSLSRQLYDNCITASQP